ncbi:MAG: hypothetical protein ACRD2C_04170 [Acidimicrobiales bacterium]
MLSDRAVVWVFVVGLVAWLVLVTQLLAGWGGWLGMVGLVCASAGLVMAVARRRVFAWLDSREAARRECE